MIDLDKAVDRFVNLQLRKNPESNYHWVVSHMYDISNNISLLEEQGVPKDEIQDHLKEAYVTVGGSPFYHRMQTWPRGYPGDFETIQYLLDATNKAEENSIHYIEPDVAAVFGTAEAVNRALRAVIQGAMPALPNAV